MPNLPTIRMPYELCECQNCCQWHWHLLSKNQSEVIAAINLTNVFTVEDPGIGFMNIEPCRRDGLVLYNIVK
ncbi:hypothetical protein AG1IA_07804 [Rhizoctonia solani AG-1 IA]|uniref:Uncharacterized protein n=1 Tax=Thanatephorus cucumeris (strain AG1-IA) TaxID=983506 RepID=L8WP67_THACA|nr:hypothetical protein AG1IA_07804 [Rhizoctonia solani AG-1 IA]